MDRPKTPFAVAKALALPALAALLLWGCSGEKEEPSRAFVFPVLKYFPSSTKVLCGIPSPSTLESAAGGKVPSGLGRAFWDQAAPGGFGPFSREVLAAGLSAWRTLEKEGAAPATAWFGSEASGGGSGQGGILVLDFHRRKEGVPRSFPAVLKRVFSEKGKAPGGWILSSRGEGSFILRKGKKEIPLEGASLGKAYVLVFDVQGGMDRVRAAWSGKAPSLEGKAWANRVKSTVAEGWPSRAAAPGAGAKASAPSLPARLGLAGPESLFERWAPGDGENYLEFSYGEDSGYPWSLGRLSVDPDFFASLLPSDTEAFLLGAWNTAWVKERLVPLLEEHGRKIGWLKQLLDEVKRIFGIWDYGSIPYEMVSKKMLSFGIALRPSKSGEKVEVLLAFGLPQGEESWFLGWLERGYRTQVFPVKKWWGKTNYLIYERKADPPMAGTTGKGFLFLASSRESLIGFLEAAEGRAPRLSGTGPYKAIRLSFRNPADLFLFVSPKAPAAPFRFLPGRPKDLPSTGEGPFGGGIFLEKGKVVFHFRWPFSPWNLALREVFPGK